MTTAEEELHAAIATFQACINARDRDLAQRVLDDDFALVLVVPSPAVMPRDRWLEVLADYIVHEYVVEEQRVDLDGDVAAVLTRVQMRATVLGQDRSGTFVMGDVWRRAPDGWRVWRRHSTPLSAGDMPGA
jgi:ketosteroid isomerase-like protein